MRHAIHPPLAVYCWGRKRIFTDMAFRTSVLVASRRKTNRVDSYLREPPAPGEATSRERKTLLAFQASRAFENR